MRLHRAIVLVCAAAVGCGGGEAEPDATLETSDQEIQGASDRDDLDPVTAQSYVDHVQVGTSVDVNGKVADGMESDRFSPPETIFVSMEVTDAPAGSLIRLTLFDDAGDQEVWTEELPVQAGVSHLYFSLDADDIEPGAYRAEVIIGDERVAVRRLQRVEPAA